MMNLRSLGLRSDLALIDGEILDRKTYLVVRSPREPTYYWGNLLVFPDPPQADDRERWESCFAREFSDLPEVVHRTFTWDVVDTSRTDTSKQIGAFKAAGYHHEQTVVLTASSVQPAPHHDPDLEVRALNSQSDWEAVAELQVASRGPGHQEAPYRKFVAGRLASLRARVDSGQGQWYGAFRQGQQLGNLGIFRVGNVARFQIVVTHPDARRQGVCGTLVHQVAQATLARGDVESLVMLADPEYHAARIYESVGFAATEKLDGLCRRPPSAASR